MKLQEIMRDGPELFKQKMQTISKVDAAMTQWIYDHVTYIDASDGSDVARDNVRVKDGIIYFENVKPTDWGFNIQNPENTKHVHMTIDMRGAKLDPPLPIIHNDSIFVDDDVLIVNSIIDDWSKLPILEEHQNYDVQFAVVGNKTIIKSWNGLRKYDLHRLHFNWESNESVKIECGLLELVDFPKHAFFSYSAYSNNTDPLAHQLDAAFEFLAQLRRDGGDVFEFQEYLIDHGLEQFAR
ncbi:hypothetical protein RsoM2USA_240 [Ralstonia phage RsoM2USA]|nr:hypothetical protein RsoM2USA_240 [Ralstonia phage RsoM2USA]